MVRNSLQKAVFADFLLARNRFRTNYKAIFLWDSSGGGLIMKRLFVFICFAGLLSACGNSDGSSEQSNAAKSLKLVGVTKNALTLREIVVPMEDSSLSVTCYLDETAKEVCKGEFANGETATPEQVQSALGSLQIDPKIDAILRAECDNKTLLLVVEPKLALPEVDESEFCFWTDENNTIISCDGKVVSQAEAEAINNQRLGKLKLDISSARKAGLDKFMELNPDLVNADQAKAYLDALYGALNIKMDACDWQSFIDKNRNILDIVEFRALVDNDVQKACTGESVEYKILLKADTYSDSSIPATSFKVISSKDDLDSFKSFGLNDNTINSIDFTKDVVVLLSGGKKNNTGYSLKIDDICVDSKIDVQIINCAGQPADDALSEPIMLIQLPKNNYEVEFSDREIVCE